MAWVFSGDSQEFFFWFSVGDSGGNWSRGSHFFKITACILQTGPSSPLPGKYFSHLTALATIQLTNGSFLGKSVVKFIFFHLNRFLIPRRGKPKSDPIVAPSTKYRRPSTNYQSKLREKTYLEGRYRCFQGATSGHIFSPQIPGNSGLSFEEYEHITHPSAKCFIDQIELVFRQNHIS